MRNSILLLICLIGIMASGCVQQTEQKAHDPSALPRSTPEAEGISSRAIHSFVDALDNARADNIEMHSFMIVRHGKVVAEGWWSPYRSDLKHTLYSVSKSFTSTAIGLAADEGKLSLSDNVISFFPESLPETVSPNLAELDVEDLLKMAVGQAEEPHIMRQSDDWVATFLAAPIEYEPGSVFLYNSAGSFMLSAIVQKATGEKLIDYLQPRLFGPLGIEGADWEVNPQGINVGGWGLRVKTEDMAKLGLLYLQKGRWGDQQILSGEWVEAATSKQINTVEGEGDPASDWAQGYGYQFWQTTHNAFRGDGAFGQYILVLPEQAAVVAMTANVQDMQKEINLVWEHLLPAFQDAPLPEDEEAQAELEGRLTTLSLPTYTNETTSPLGESITGKVISFNKNPLHLSEVTLRFEGDACIMEMQQDTERYAFTFGNTSWEEGDTPRQGLNLLRGTRSNQTGLAPFKVAGNYRWVDDQSLELVLRYIEGLNDERFLFTFAEPAVTVEYTTNFDFYQNKIGMEGNMQ